MLLFKLSYIHMYVSTSIQKTVDRVRWMNGSPTGRQGLDSYFNPKHDLFPFSALFLNIPWLSAEMEIRVLHV